MGYIKSGGMDFAFFMFRNVTVEAGIYMIDSHGRFNVTANAKVFVADSTGLLLADSTPGHVITQSATSVEDATLLRAEENSDALLAETARRVKQKYGKWEDVPASNTQFTFDFESITYLTLTSRLDYLETLPCSSHCDS